MNRPSTVTVVLLYAIIISAKKVHCSYTRTLRICVLGLPCDVGIRKSRFLIVSQSAADYTFVLELLVLFDLLTGKDIRSRLL